MDYRDKINMVWTPHTIWHNELFIWSLNSTLAGTFPISHNTTAEQNVILVFQMVFITKVIDHLIPIQPLYPPWYFRDPVVEKHVTNNLSVISFFMQ